MNDEDFMNIWANVPVLSLMSSWQMMASHLLLMEEEQSCNIDKALGFGVTPEAISRFIFQMSSTLARVCFNQFVPRSIPMNI